MRQRIIIILFTLLLANTGIVFGQDKFKNYNFDTTKTYVFELKDGSQFVGNFLQRDSILIVIKTESIPKIEIPFTKLKRIEAVDPSNMKKGEYWFPNPNKTRYLFAPSAFTLKKGEGYYQNTYLFLSSVNVGITDNISIGGGVEFLSTFGSLAEGKFQPVFIITPKIGFQVAEKIHLGAGILYVSIPGYFSDKRTGLGIAYGLGTYGTEDHNVTLGIGWGVVQGEFSNKPIIAFSGMTRISRKTALVTENWFFPADLYYGVFSYGIRFFGEKLTVDFALLNNKDIAEGLVIGIPYVDFVVKF